VWKSASTKFGCQSADVIILKSAARNLVVPDDFSAVIAPGRKLEGRGDTAKRAVNWTWRRYTTNPSQLQLLAHRHGRKPAIGTCRALAGP